MVSSKPVELLGNAVPSVSEPVSEPTASTPPLSAGQRPKLLIAASGTGGHLFPALATAEVLSDYQIEWLGVPDRLETQLVPDCYPLHTVRAEGFQQKLGVKTAFSTARTASRLLLSILTEIAASGAVSGGADDWWLYCSSGSRSGSLPGTACDFARI